MDQEIQTLCWSCKHAVPRLIDGEYVHGCEWSTEQKPVPGWTAEKCMRKVQQKNGRYYGLGYGYYVIKCPKFSRG